MVQLFLSKRGSQDSDKANPWKACMQEALYMFKVSHKYQIKPDTRNYKMLISHL
jgi:hypothetical protein